MPSKRTRTVVQLSLCDSLPAYGPIADMTFSLARNGVRSILIVEPTHCLLWFIVLVRIVQYRSLLLQLVQVPSEDSHYSRSVTMSYTEFQSSDDGRHHFIQRDLPIRTKRKLHAIGGARGMWSLPIRQPLRSNGVAHERPVNPFQMENDTLILSTDANPSPGLSRVESTQSRKFVHIS
jgi:cleavage and polyadenylation specificity factor subunit 1